MARPKGGGNPYSKKKKQKENAADHDNNNTDEDDDDDDRYLRSQTPTPFFSLRNFSILFLLVAICIRMDIVDQETAYKVVQLAKDAKSNLNASVRGYFETGATGTTGTGTSTTPTPTTCYQSLKDHMGLKKGQDLSLPIVVHHNGEAEPCGEATVNLHAVKSILKSMGLAQGACPLAHDKINDKNFIDSLLTLVLQTQVGQTCGPSTEDTTRAPGLFQYCDMGQDHTVEQANHFDMAPIQLQDGQYLPCHYHLSSGLRLAGVQQWVEHSSQSSSSQPLHLHAVPAGRYFMFAGSFVGERIPLPHVKGAEPKQPVALKVLALEPRLFEIENFFSPTESAALIEEALNPDIEGGTFEPSSSTSHGVDQQEVARRTSEQVWRTETPLAKSLLKRCFATLGFDEYLHSHADGLQVLRYNTSTAHIPHMDTFDQEDATSDYNYDSSGAGGNRFATILLYMSDMDEHAGGETVFPNIWPAVTDRLQGKEAIQQLRDSGDATALEQDSWQETMAAHCRTVRMDGLY
jgi:hypothetical protein